MRILVVDDDLALADVVSFTLRRAGFGILVAHDGLSALEQWRNEKPDLIILDLRLPRLDGFAVCRTIRSESDVPIIILSVHGEDDHVVTGLELGADDYITKPFSPRQLVARVKAALRRAGEVSVTDVLIVGNLTLDENRREVHIADRAPVQLTQLECRVLKTFIMNEGQVLSADALIGQVWGPDGASKSMLKQLIYRLRQKLEIQPDYTHFIETIPGVGYALVRQEKR